MRSAEPKPRLVARGHPEDGAGTTHQTWLRQASTWPLPSPCYFWAGRWPIEGYQIRALVPCLASAGQLPAKLPDNPQPPRPAAGAAASRGGPEKGKRNSPAGPTAGSPPKARGRWRAPVWRSLGYGNSPSHGKIIRFRVIVILYLIKSTLGYGLCAPSRLHLPFPSACDHERLLRPCWPNTRGPLLVLPSP